MQVPKDSNIQGVVIAPGNYDGVHRGHQRLLARAREMASAQQLLTRALTFDPHPAAFFAPKHAPEPLTTPARRRELLLAHGADEVEIATFDRAYASQSPEQFVERLLQGGMRAIVVGQDFRFGKGAAGTVDVLHALAARTGFSVAVEEPVLDHGERISSSAVRESLREGRVEDAARMLGHAHDITGVVEEGDGRGHRLGFPTANVRAEHVLHPADGVYAVHLRRLGGEFELLAGVANLGTRPTFHAGRSFEVHLLDFDGPLYGEAVRVGFVARLRGEVRFDNAQALQLQIGKDCRDAEQILKVSDPRLSAWI